MNRKYVYAFLSHNGTCNVVNYDAENCYVNSFLRNFDAWGSHGCFKISEDNNFQEVWFEGSKELFNLLHTETFRLAFKHMKVEIVFEYPFKGI